MSENTVEPIERGDLVKHIFIEEFTGIVTSITAYLNGCRRLSVQPMLLKDGKPLAESVFDENELVVVESGVVPIGDERVGGPRPVPPKVQAPG